MSILPPEGTRQYFDPNFQRGQFHLEILGYEEDIAAVMRRINEAVSLPLTSNDINGRPSTPPILRVEYADHALTLRGRTLEEKIASMYRFLVSLDIFPEEILAPFVNQQQHVQSLRYQVATKISGLKRDLAPAVNLLDHWPAGDGHSPEAYRQRFVEAIVPVPEVKTSVTGCFSPDDFGSKDSATAFDSETP